MISLGFVETSVYFCIWIFCVLYSLYNVYLVGDGFNHSDHDIYKYDDFQHGWLLNRFQDVSDYEWNSWTRITICILPGLLVNLIGAELLRAYKLSPFHISLWYTLVSVTISLIVIKASAVAFLTLIPISFYLLLYFRQPLLLWLLGFLLRRYIPAPYFGESDEETYIVEVASSWLVLRCIAYSLEDISSNRRSLTTMLAFTLYLPTLFYGPLLSFSSFKRGLVCPYKKWDKERLLKIFLQFSRFIWWYIFTIIALHYVYVNAILLRPYMVQSMTVWELVGLGIAMGQFFHLKYVIFYGIPCTWAAAEGYQTPKSPCCVTRVYLYSFMWRYFDHGLYLYLIRYIYVPVLNFMSSWKTKRFIASVACFLFVYIWHGEEVYVLCWVVLNFLSLSIESIARQFCCLPSVSRLISALFSEANQRRIHCLFAAPLHYFSMISNYFFIGSFEIGKIYFYRAFRESLTNNFYMLLFLYGAAQTSLTIEINEKRNGKRC